MRVVDLDMTRSLNASYVFHPAPPASRAAVTPVGRQWASGVEGGGDAGRQAVGVRQDEALVAIKMGVQIDQPGHDKEPRYVHDPPGG